MVWGGFFSIYTVFRHTGTASLLISLREAARKVPNFAQPIILAYGTYASAKISRHSVAAWLYGVLRKKHINRDGAKALTPPKNRSLHGTLSVAG